MYPDPYFTRRIGNPVWFIMSRNIDFSRGVGDFIFMARAANPDTVNDHPPCSSLSRAAEILGSIAIDHTPAAAIALCGASKEILGHAIGHVVPFLDHSGERERNLIATSPISDHRHGLPYPF